MSRSTKERYNRAYRTVTKLGSRYLGLKRAVGVEHPTTKQASNELDHYTKHFHRVSKQVRTYVTESDLWGGV